MRHVSLVVAFVLAGLTACSNDSPLQQNEPHGLQALIFDGAHSAGNKDFFFLPPLVASPVGTPNYDAGRFNPRLVPTVEICKLAASPLLVPNTDCAGAPAFGPARMTLDASNQQYQLNWDTQASLLDATAFYRISVRGAARGTVLGFLDVDPVLGGMKNVKTGDVFQFQDGRTLPIKVRIELGAFGSSNSSDQAEVVVPNVLPATGLDVTTNTGFAGAHFSDGWLPAGIDQVVVIIERLPVQNGSAESSCLNTPLEQLEGCYRFRTDPDLHGIGPDGTDLLFQVPVVAGICFQYPGDIGHDNQHPFQIFRSEEVLGRVTPAVPLDEVPAPFLRCDGFGATPPSIGAAFRAGRVGDVAKAGLYAVTHAIGRVLEPKALHAVDFGAGGSTNEFSRFGFARTAALSVTSGNGASAPAGTTVDAAVAVQNDHHGVLTPVAGQSVTFTVTSGGGTVSTSTCSEGPSCAVNTNSDGNADVTWRLGAGENTISVTTSYVSNSPQTITATGTASTFTVQTLKSALEYPTGLWVSGGQVYYTETADHNTTFGGARRLSRFTLDGSQSVLLIDNPINSDALVATNAGAVYLGSYVSTIPGDAGRVSVAANDIDVGWVETPLTTLAIAVSDMYLDANQNIFVIGSSDNPDASSLYFLPVGKYDSPVVIQTGMGRVGGMTLLSGDIFYSVLGANKVHRISEGTDQVLFDGEVLTLTTDGTYLYYGDLAGDLSRRNLSTGAVESLFSGPGQINAARYDAASQTLFFLRSGTAEAQYKDGSLNSIYLGPVIQ